jgi:hypothetical protein
MQRRVPRMPALFDEIFGCLVFDADLDELPIGAVIFAKMGTHPALAFVDVQHEGLLSTDGQICTRRAARVCKFGFFRFISPRTRTLAAS